MPRIKAYKNGTSKRQLIPVEAAKVCTAYQCPWTNEIFGTKRQYVEHLKELRETRMRRRARIAKFEKVRAEFNSQKTFGDIIQWIENHPEFFFDTAVTRPLFPRPCKPTDRENFYIKILDLTVRWDESVSNTHNCPRGGKTNWGGRKPNVPHGYPGWRGRITFSVRQYNPDGTINKRPPAHGSEVFNNTGICTGSGGGGSNSSSYDVIFFDADWPGLDRAREQRDVLAALGNDDSQRHRFRYSASIEPAFG